MRIGYNIHKSDEFEGTKIECKKAGSRSNGIRPEKIANYEPGLRLQKFAHPQQLAGQLSTPDHEISSCGVVYWRDLLIRPGRCLFCNDNRSWTDAPKLKLHIESHSKGLQEGTICCPHRLYHKQHDSRDDLKLHLISAHGIELDSKSSRGSKRNSQELSV